MAGVSKIHIQCKTMDGGDDKEVGALTSHRDHDITILHELSYPGLVLL